MSLTDNIISHLGQKHKIYKHSKLPSSIPSTKQVKINNYIILSDSISQMIPDQQKYLETLLFEIFDIYEFSQKQFKQYIHENSNSVSLTCDLWTSHNKQEFLSVTCYLITPDFKIKKITLTIRYMLYPHTGDAIQKELKKIILEWELQDKGFFCITDNTASMKKYLNQIS
ncbi:zinc finger BED domain-containing protein RICESLEEPER 2-like [Rhizophagus clarus]|uniref:Zinc finger BED domain-containing protein RICESLEEPER 2-like n=1 Tax=Rhizophagus clarus TaxID=94130 RepID=A0A8H3QG01_9GLOM|nr:zinc finger BED domain-containing protein RICESLEEPER 2-like [Rhizophagus clarus]